MSLEKIKKNNGFTFFEALLVVGIISILCGIAIPLIFAVQSNMMMKKMDDTARQIYMLAQNDLTQSKANGSLSNLQTTVEDSYSQQNLKKINAKPADYISVDDNWQNLYYLKKGDEALDTYILKSSSLTAGLLNGGHYIIEFNPNTAVVYGVFYSDNAFTYDDIKDLKSRTQSFRKSKMLGYYGGVNLNISDAMLPTEFTPSVQVINKEDLYLKITCSGLRYIAQTQNYLTMEITVTDEDYKEGSDDHKWVYQLQGGDPDFFVSATGDVESNILLDSLSQGKDFKTITGSKLNPGDDLKVTVKLVYSRNDILISGSANTVTNSLFDSKTVDSNGKVTINVANLRHLNNLRNTKYNANTDFDVVQTKTIDFDSSNWDDDSTVSYKNGSPVNGLADSGFAGITNDYLRSYNGSSNELKNIRFVGVSSGNYAGLFADTENSTLSNINFSDCKADGTQYVGLLAGRTNNVTINNCEAHLTLTDSDGRAHSNMEERVETYIVNGQDYVGGLVGYANTNTSFTDSFAAVNVKANTYAGGLVGAVSGSTVKSCYASGKINAANYAGGITSYASGTNFSNCYSTSDVKANTYAAGFAGALRYSSVINSTTYGAITKTDGTIDKATSGPFCGSMNSNSSITNCRYLKQGKYNANYTTTASYGTATGYDNIKDSNGNSSAFAHPYTHSLYGQSFPFTMIKDTKGNVIEHYGDWPAELTLQTSLVYYERYEDGEYGFYAKTSLKDEMEDDSGSVNDWTVDTLRDEYCVEDGYALMTIYQLSDISYQLNSGEVKHLTIAESVDDAQDGKACLITDNKTLTFTKDNLSYTLHNARVYQLPYDLQMTKRYHATRFYDRLTITGMVGSYTAIDNNVFYYCPDFAKNAINPDPESLSSSTDYPSDPSGSSEPIIIRSPRQLNALGYAPYYWNPSNGSQSFYFKQETDLVYSKYARNSSGNAVYCGKTYNLMDTSLSNPYRNRPIGQPKNQNFATPDGYATNKSGNFRQTYDGTGHKIIDYCLETYTTTISGTNSTDSYQFTGLFGEAESAVIKNVVMTVTNANENNSSIKSSGYVISHTDDGTHHIGVGVLLGLSYVEVNGNNGTSRTTVQNCAVSGYDVGYEGTAKTFSVGGLVGYNFGTITNSSAVIRNLTFTDRNGNYTQNTKYIGGLVGSLNGSGTISQSYCGANVKADNYDNSHYGLIAGGSDDIYGYGSRSSDWNNFSKRNNSIELCYSYGNWTGMISYLWFGSTKSTVYNCVQKIGFNNLSIKQCFYVTDDIDTRTVTIENSDSKNVEDFSASTLRAMTQNQVNLNSNPYRKLWSNNIVVKTFSKTTAANSFPWSSSQTGAYQYPVFVRKVDDNGNLTDYVHYGTFSY